MHVIDLERSRCSTKKSLIRAATLTFALALGCSADDAEVMSGPVDAATGHADASLEDPWEDEEAPGCTATDEAVEPLPEMAPYLYPADKAERMSGAWTNAQGDVLTVELARAGRLHLFTGSPSSVNGRAPGACETHNYVAVDATMTLQASDGSFDEVIEGEVRIGTFTTFKANMWLDDLEGSYTADVESAVIGWQGHFGYRSDGWDLEASIDDDEAAIVLPAFEERQ